MRRSVRYVKFSQNAAHLNKALIVYDGSHIQKNATEALPNDGYIGWGIMQSGIASFDLTGPEHEWSSKFTLIKELPIKYNLTGFSGIRLTPDGHYEIAGLKDISPARESGIKTGDVIVSMNGIAVNSAEFTNQMRRSIFQGDLGLKVPVEIKRGDDIINRVLVLRNYLEPDSEATKPITKK